NTTGSSCPAAVAWTIRPNPYDPSLAGCGGSSGQTPLNSAGGTQFAMADLDAGGSGVVADTSLNSPSINASSLSTLRLSYRQFYKSLSGQVGTVDVSTDGGGSWTTVKTYTRDQGASAAFATDSVVLDGFAGNANVMIRFRITGGWDWWWAIDDVSVTT